MSNGGTRDGNEPQEKETGPRYRVGDRVEEVERVGLAKVVRYEGPDGYGGHTYLIREFAHPHRMVVADEQHLGPPRGRTHDPAADPRIVRSAPNREVKPL